MTDSANKRVISVRGIGTDKSPDCGTGNTTSSDTVHLTSSGLNNNATDELSSVTESADHMKEVLDLLRTRTHLISQIQQCQAAIITGECGLYYSYTMSAIRL